MTHYNLPRGVDNFIGWTRIDARVSWLSFLATCTRCGVSRKTNYVGLVRCASCHQRLKQVWVNMNRRCHDRRDPAYRHYGARGIRVCKRWRESFEAFLEDMDFPLDARMSLDRINNNGDYEPFNCRWATTKEQALNTRRSYNAADKLPAWVDTEVAARVLDVDPSTVRTYCDRKLLRSKHVGRTVLVSSNSIIAYMTGRKRPGRPKTYRTPKKD